MPDDNGSSRAGTALKLEPAYESALIFRRCNGIRHGHHACAPLSPEHANDTLVTGSVSPPGTHNDDFKKRRDGPSGELNGEALVRTELSRAYSDNRRTGISSDGDCTDRYDT